MPQTAIFSPMFATIALTFVVWVYLYARRIPFIRSLDPKVLEEPGAFVRLSPASVSNPSDNFRNLFEVPIVFYALALYLFVTQQVDAVYVVVAWVFAVFRVLHSAMHCTINVIIVRFYLYLVSTLAVWFMAARALVQHVAG